MRQNIKELARHHGQQDALDALAKFSPADVDAINLYQRLHAQRRVVQLHDDGYNAKDIARYARIAGRAYLRIIREASAAYEKASAA